MCSRSCSHSSNALIVGALFLIIVEINQTNCNSILPAKPVPASGSSVASLKLHIDNDSSSSSGSSSRSDEDSPVTSSSTPPVVVTLPGSTTVAPGTGGGADLGGQIPLERLPSNTLLKYTAYKDVSILHFRIPTDTRTAFFSFKAYEESKSAFRKYIFCDFLNWLNIPQVPCFSSKILIFKGDAWYFSTPCTFVLLLLNSQVWLIECLNKCNPKSQNHTSKSITKR